MHDDPFVGRHATGCFRCCRFFFLPGLLVVCGKSCAAVRSSVVREPAVHGKAWCPWCFGGLWGKEGGGVTCRMSTTVISSPAPAVLKN